MSELDIKIKKQKGLKREINVSVPSSLVEAKKRNRFEELTKKAKLPGFRPGKAPLNIIQSQYWNQVNKEVLEMTYAEVIQDKELKPAGPPEVSIDQFVDGSDFKYTATIEVFPEFELKDVDKIQVDKYTSTITQTDINEMMDNLQQQRGEWKSVQREEQKGAH